VDSEIGEIWLPPELAIGRTPSGATLAQASSEGLAYFRTSDAGLMIDGALVVVGRWRHRVEGEARTYSLEEVERFVERCHPALRPNCGVVFVDALPGPALTVIHELERRHWRDPATVSADEAPPLRIPDPRVDAFAADISAPESARSLRKLVLPEPST